MITHSIHMIFGNYEKSGAQKVETFTMIGYYKSGCFTPPTKSVSIIFANNS